MFSFLQEVPVNDLVSGVHHAIRLLNYRDTKNLDYDDSGTQSLASKITTEIQQVENVPIKQLDTKKTSKYVNRLTRIVLRRMNGELGLKHSSGHNLIEKLREQKIDKVVRFDEVMENDTALSQLAMPILKNQELIGMLNIESQKNLLFEDKLQMQEFVSQVAEWFQSAQKKKSVRRDQGMRFLTPLFFNIFIEAIEHAQHLPTSNFFVSTRPLHKGVEIRVYGIEYRRFDMEPFLSNLYQSFINNWDRIESRTTSRNLFTEPTLHHFVGQSFEEVKKEHFVEEVEESQTDIVIRLEEVGEPIRQKSATKR